MPPKKANKKQIRALSLVDSEILNSETKDLIKEAPLDGKTLINGSEVPLEDELKETMRATKATKRSSGRVKNSAPTEAAEEETSVDKKPAAKGKAKKKKEIEVIQNENEVKHEIKEEEIEAEAVVNKAVEEKNSTKQKGRGGSKKSKTETKKTKALKETEKLQNTEGHVQETESTQLEKAEKKTKASAGKGKKQDATSVKEIENVEVKQEVTDEQANKKPSRGTKKAPETSLDVEPPQKKRGKTPKGNAQEDQVDQVPSEINSNEIKKEKKPTKRGRNAAKADPEVELNAEVLNGDITEEVLPKKRSRKAVDDTKEIVAETTKKGRGKKLEKISSNNIEKEAAAASLKENDVETNGDIKEENLEYIEEFPKKNKKIGKKSEHVDSQTIDEVTTTTKARLGGRKRAAPSTINKKKSKIAAAEDKMDNGQDNEIEDEADGDSKPSKTTKKKDAAPLNPTGTKYNREDFELAPLPEGETAEKLRYNLKISSWNVAGLRSWLKKEGLKFLEYEQPDIFCMQEIKCTTDQLPEEVERIPGYHPYWLCMPGGYAGVAIYSKIMPINVEYGIGNKEFDNAGRIITAEYEKFFLINVYVPNSGRKLVNLDARMKWEKIFQEFVKKLDARKPVVICGDMNVSHQEIDLANPKTNTRNAGFTKEERDKMTELLSLGYIDTFRHLYPERKAAYTFWSYMGNARSRNVGWRLDYFIVSERFVNRVVDNCIRSQCMGSDHCPITLFMKL